jgi:hypothetical protein
MPAPFSNDLRTRVLAAYDRGMPTIQIARTFDVSPACGPGGSSSGDVRPARSGRGPWVERR